MIKAIIFDLGGVLLDLDMPHCFGQVQALGIDVTALSKAITSDGKNQGATICEGVTAAGIMNLYQTGKTTTEEFLGFLQQQSRPGTTLQQVLDAWNSCLLSIPPYKLQFIQELRAEGYHTYLLSNTNDAHWNYSLKHHFPEPISHYFDQAFVSQQLGLAKPDPNIYLEVLRQIPYEADQCLFIDDSKVNCQAAESIGIHTYNAPVRTDFRAEIRNLL